MCDALPKRIVLHIDVSFEFRQPYSSNGKSPRSYTTLCGSGAGREAERAVITAPGEREANAPALVSLFGVVPGRTANGSARLLDRTPTVSEDECLNVQHLRLEFFGVPPALCC